MENSRYSLHDDKRFKDELDECYFHPSRKYASEEIKFIARNAMLLLWDQNEKVSEFHIPISRTRFGDCSIKIIARHFVEHPITNIRF